MQQIIDKFQKFHQFACELTNGMGLVNPDRDAAFYGISKAAIARQMMLLSSRMKTDDTETLLDALRGIHNAVALEIRGGLPADARAPLVELLIEGWK